MSGSGGPTVTMELALLLAAGTLLGRLAGAMRLPSVTGFIVAGLLLGPSALGLVTPESMGDRLNHFSEIALMLIAFGIGEHIELRRLRGLGRDVGAIAVVQAVAAFVLVGLAVYFTARLGREDLNPAQCAVLGLLLGAVAVATAPAAVLHVVRETGARGPLTSTLMAVVAVDDGLAIMIFGIAVSAAHQVAGGDSGAAAAALAAFREIAGSLAAGVLTGFLMDKALHHLHRRGEMLTGGLAMLLLCGETCRLFHLSPLLAGMAAGFTIINQAKRDERLFRSLNAFEPPIYVLFFTLAGSHLDLAALRLGGWIGAVYFLVRIAGKYGGSWLGALISRAPAVVRDWIGLALIPQAGVAIGLTFLIASDPALAAFSALVTPVVLAGVVLSELLGPLLARLTLERAGETSAPEENPVPRPMEQTGLEPWDHQPLRPAGSPRGVVAFGAAHYATVRGLARVAVILAHHYHALPLSVRVLPPRRRGRLSVEELKNLCLPERDEAENMGYPLRCEIIYDQVASGLVSATEYNQAQTLVMGYPLAGSPRALRQMLEQVAANVLCPVVIVRFSGILRMDRILVPLVRDTDAPALLPLLEALATACHPRIRLLRLLDSDARPEEVEEAREALDLFVEENFAGVDAQAEVLAAESRLGTIQEQALDESLVVLTTGGRQGIGRLFFGSLAAAVARALPLPLFILYTPDRHGDGHGEY